MKTQFLYFFALAFLISFTACKKDSGSTADDNEMAVHSDDQSRFASEIDAAANDADIAIESSSSFSGRLQNVQSLICDASIVANSASNPKTITITYNGTNCQGNRTRTGVIVLSMAQGVQWKNAGAAISVSFQNFRITRISDNKSITINGTQTFTNVSGGLLINLASPSTITHAITSDGLSVTFDNGSQRNWKVAKQRIFTYNNGVVITSSGTHTEGSSLNIAEWGTNRFGAAFATSTVEPVVVRQDCNFRITSGKVKHTTPLVTATVTFGLNATGVPTTCPGTGTYYYQAIWTGQNGNSLSLILPY